MALEWIGPAASIGGSLLGGLLGGSDRDAARKAAKANEDRYRAAIGYGQYGMGLMDNAVRAARTTRDAGLAKAESGVRYGRDQIESTGGAERRRIAESYQQQQGANTASAMQRGLYNTSVLDASQRAATIDMNRANLELTDRLAELRAGYAMGEADFLLRAYRDRGDFEISAAQQQNNLISRQIDTITGRTDVAAQNNGAALGGQLAGQAGDLLGSILKGGAVIKD